MEDLILPSGNLEQEEENLEVIKGIFHQLQSECCHPQRDGVLNGNVRPCTEEALHRLALNGPRGTSAGGAG